MEGKSFVDVLLRPKMCEISLRGWLPLPLPLPLLEALALPERDVVEVVQGWVNSQGGSWVCSCLVGVGWRGCLDGVALGLGVMVVDALGE